MRFVSIEDARPGMCLAYDYMIPWDVPWWEVAVN